MDLGLNLLLNLGLSLSIDPCHNDNGAGDERRGIMLLMMTARSTWFLNFDSPTGLRPQRYGMASKTGNGIALPAGNSTAWPTGHALWQHTASPTGNTLHRPLATPLHRPLALVDFIPLPFARAPCGGRGGRGGRGFLARVWA